MTFQYPQERHRVCLLQSLQTGELSKHVTGGPATTLPKPFIVKIQITDRGNAGTRMLIYNEDRSILFEEAVNPLDRREFKYTGGMYKQFFHATLKLGLLDVDTSKPAPWQEW